MPKLQGKSSKKERITLVLPEATMEKLDNLRREIDSSSNVEVFRRALALFELVKDEERQGNQVCIRDGDGNITAIRIM